MWETLNIQTRWLAGLRERESARVGDFETLTLSPEPPIRFTRKQLYPAQNRITHLPKWIRRLRRCVVGVWG